MKKLVLTLMCCSLLLCACGKVGDNVAEVVEPVAETEQVVEQTQECEEQKLTIVSDYDPQYGQQWNGNVNYTKISHYAEYTDTGIQMMTVAPDFVSGRLLYTVNNVRIVNRLDSPDGSEVVFDRVLSKFQTDGTLEGHKFILVDVTVFNDGAEKEKGRDKYDEEIDPYTFSAGGLLFLYNDSIQPGNGVCNYDGIRYFVCPSPNKGVSSDEFAFCLMPEEEVTLTLGFAIGKAGEFDSTEHLFLSNSTGNKDSIIIDMKLGE